ncbi:MAG: TraC family protein, partial [Nitrososphaerales archaeon]
MFSDITTKIASLLGENTDYGIAGDTFSPSNRAASAFLQSHSLSKILPYLSYDPHSQLFYNPSSVGFVFETLPLVGADTSIERQLEGLFQHTLPQGSNLQVLLIASPRIEEQLQTWQSPRLKQGGVFQTLASKRIEFLRTLAIQSSLQSSYRLRTFRVIVSYSQDGADLTPLEKEKLLSLKSQIITSFQGLGMPVRSWDAGDLIRRLDEILNFEGRLDFPSLEWNPYQDIASQIMAPSSNLLVHEEGLLQNDGEHSMLTYSVKSFPQTWHLGGMGTLIGDPLNDFLQIPCPFLIHYGVHICDEKMLQSRMLQKCSQVEKQAYSPIAKWVPSLKQEAEEWKFVRQQFEEGQRLVRTRYQVVLLGNTEEMNQAQQLLFNLYRANRWELQLDRFLQLPSLISCLPMSWGEGMAHDNTILQATKTTLSHEPTNLMPIQGEWMGTSTPGMILSGRRGQIFYWSPFDNKDGNYNTCVVGKSGSGKSVFMQELMTSTLGLGGRVFVLDVGRSFEKTAKLLGGQFIEFSTHSPICINPFSTIPTDNAEATSDALAMLKPIIALMAAPGDGTNDLENAYIEKALHQTWQDKGKEACI